MFQLAQRSGKAPVLIMRFPGSTDTTILLPVRRNYTQTEVDRMQQRLDTGKLQSNKKTSKKNRKNDEKDEDETRRKVPKKIISTLIKSHQAPRLCLIDVYMVIAGVTQPIRV
ncbi:uncharacterized protein LOC117588590 [Drosophila guanche]|uniref:Uncharacterized protein n=1 Tax=Drosophila guanche TaxID=7266 RepID=A0A3B0JX25_DROGU|nr:uncharacterized protein LOC117588590 [Drosophila guanche]SPP86627.1 Hypothetical predicted protein [Drosophila guanche]